MRTTLCLEPNPQVYGGDYLLDAAETAAIVQDINSAGIAMNFDMGEQSINGSDEAAILDQVLPLVGHFHASEPMLEPFDSARHAHSAAAVVLREKGYSGAISLEMKIPPKGLSEVEEALRGMLSAYQL